MKARVEFEEERRRDARKLPEQAVRHILNRQPQAVRRKAAARQRNPDTPGIGQATLCREHSRGGEFEQGAGSQRDARPARRSEPRDRADVRVIDPPALADRLETRRHSLGLTRVERRVRRSRDRERDGIGEECAGEADVGIAGNGHDQADVSERLAQARQPVGHAHLRERLRNSRQLEQIRVNGRCIRHVLGAVDVSAE